MDLSGYSDEAQETGFCRWQHGEVVSDPGQHQQTVETGNQCLGRLRGIAKRDLTLVHRGAQDRLERRLFPPEKPGNLLGYSSVACPNLQTDVRDERSTHSSSRLPVSVVKGEELLQGRSLSVQSVEWAPGIPTDETCRCRPTPRLPPRAVVPASMERSGRSFPC